MVIRSNWPGRKRKPEGQEKDNQRREHNRQTDGDPQAPCQDGLQFRAGLIEWGDSFQHGPLREDSGAACAALAPPATRRNMAPEDDENLRVLVASGMAVSNLVGKSWTLHVDGVLRVDREESIAWRCGNAGPV